MGKKLRFDARLDHSHGRSSQA